MRAIERVYDFTDADLQEIYRKSEAADIISLKSIEDDFLERVEVEPSSRGMRMPWSDIDDKVRLRVGEISVWAGINGHKKSTIMNQVAVHIAQQAPVGIASFEMALSDTAYLMCKQAGAVDRPTQEFAKDFLDWADGKIWLYRALGGVKPIEALGAIRQFAEQGCKLVVIDNLQFCGVTEDIEKERQFVNQLVGLSAALNIHIAVVHHVRKPQSGGDEYVPTRFDVRGGGTIVDQAHLLFICWHNKAKAQIEQLEEMGIDTGDRGEKFRNQPHFKLIVAKQRHAPFEGTIQLWEGKGQTFKRNARHNNVRIDLPRNNASS